MLLKTRLMGRVPGGSSADEIADSRTGFALKIVATWLLCALMWVLWSSPAGEAAFGSYLDAFGYVGITAVFTAFLAAVALYCRTLERCLRLVQGPHRAAQPGSVWLMFLIPYNFIEDFFIVSNVTRSLRQEAATNPRLQVDGRVASWSGPGWCTAQLVSLVPGRIGEMAGLAGVILWAIHWRSIAKANRLLALR